MLGHAMQAAPSFEQVHREFRPRVLRYLSRLAGPQEAPDLTQVTMLKVSEHLAAFRGESSLATWVYRIATNVAIDAARASAPATESLDSLLQSCPDRSPAPALETESAEHSAQRAEMSDCVSEFVDRLPAHYRAVLLLSDVEGCSNREISQILALTVDAAKIRLHRARAALRR